MNKFIEYQRFPDMESATELIALLEANQIPFEIDDSAKRFDLSASTINPLDNPLVIKINEVDFSQVNLLFASKVKQGDEPSNMEHYLYSFSDNDIVDVLVNREDWTKEDFDLAQQISKERGLKPTAELIKTLRSNRNAAKSQSTQTKRIALGGASWFLWIGILSIINTVDFAFNNSVFFVFGLGINQVIDGLMQAMSGSVSGNFVAFGTVLNILVSSLFIVFWYFAKKQKQWAYLAGIILYTLDTTIFVVASDWLSVGFHVFLLYALISGYILVLKNQKETMI